MPEFRARLVELRKQCGEPSYDDLKAMADRFGYVFYVIPGPAPFMNMAYWGPPIRVGVLQSAISINVGPFSTAE